jgi:hypothetical protein
MERSKRTKQSAWNEKETKKKIEEENQRTKEKKNER